MRISLVPFGDVRVAVSALLDSVSPLKILSRSKRRVLGLRETAQLAEII